MHVILGITATTYYHGQAPHSYYNVDGLFVTWTIDTIDSLYCHWSIHIMFI